MEGEGEGREDRQQAGGNADMLAAPEVVLVAGIIRDREEAQHRARHAPSPRADHGLSHGAIVAP